MNKAEKKVVVATYTGISFWEKVFNQKYLIAMSAPFVLWFIVFFYAPLFGWIMAIQNYKPGISFLKQKWVGLIHFKEFLTDNRFYEVLRNTFVMGLANVVFTFIFSVLLAILLNEVRNRFYKRTIQTLSYLPYFVSWVVTGSLVYTILSTDGGAVNALLMTLGVIKEPYAFMADEKMFWVIITIAQIWKQMGWNSIIYISAISGIDQELYEAAEVDGVGRLGKIWHITLPGIRGTASVMLVLAVGGLLTNASGFDVSFLLGNSMTRVYSDNLSVYAFRYGIELSRYSMSTAISIFNSMVSIILLFTANKLVSKISEEKLI